MNTEPRQMLVFRMYKEQHCWKEQFTLVPVVQKSDMIVLCTANSLASRL